MITPAHALFGLALTLTTCPRQIQGYALSALIAPGWILAGELGASFLDANSGDSITVDVATFSGAWLTFSSSF